MNDDNLPPTSGIPIGATEPTNIPKNQAPSGINQGAISSDSQPALGNTVASPADPQSPTSEETAPKFQATTGQPAQTAAASPAYASFWLRLAAWLIDMIIIAIGRWPINFIVNIIYASQRTNFSVTSSDVVEINPNPTPYLPYENSSALLLLKVGLILMVLELLYFIVMTVLWGGSAGKLVLGIKVVDANGQRINWIQAIVRETIGKFISILPIIIPLGYIWVTFDAKKQAWHDKLAGTYVVKK